MLFFHCCYHIEWILVKTNHLGLSEYLINKKKKEKADACLPTLNSAAIWNVPAVDCIQKLLPSPNLIDPGICTAREGTGEAQALGPWGKTSGPWDDDDGQE